MEAVQVHRQWVDRELVATRLPGDGDVAGGREGLSEPGQVAVERVVGALRQAVRPDPVHSSSAGTVRLAPTSKATRTHCCRACPTAMIRSSTRTSMSLSSRNCVVMPNHPRVPELSPGQRFA